MDKRAVKQSLRIYLYMYIFCADVSHHLLALLGIPAPCAFRRMEPHARRRLLCLARPLQRTRRATRASTSPPLFPPTTCQTSLSNTRLRGKTSRLLRAATTILPPRTSGRLSHRIRASSSCTRNIASLFRPTLRQRRRRAEFLPWYSIYLVVLPQANPDCQICPYPLCNLRFTP